MKLHLLAGGLVLLSIISFSSCETDDVEPDPMTNNGNPSDTTVNTTIGFIINEVLYDPAGGNIGDANGDGIRDANDDEFIEFYNGTASVFDLSGFKVTVDNLGTDSLDRHIFPKGTVLASGQALLLFGGGTPTGNFGGSVVQTASDGQLNLNNSGDFITLYDTLGGVVLTFDVEPLSNNPDESYTRSPDLTGDFVQHTDVNTALFSPGTKVDGTPF